MNKVELTKVPDKLLNPIFKALTNIGIGFPGVVILETVGRKSGQVRNMPVGGRRDGNNLWIMAEHGMKNAYVLNIDSDPRVRVKIRGRWFSGTAHMMPDDNPIERLRKMVKGTIGLRLIEGVTRLHMTEPLTIRVELD